MEKITKIVLTEHEKTFIAPLIRSFRIGEQAMTTLRDFIRLRIRQNGLPDSTNAALDMTHGESINIIEDETNLLTYPGFPFPSQVN